MAEWLMRGTVNTFFRGSIPLDALYKFIFKRNKINNNKNISNNKSEHVEMVNNLLLSRSGRNSLRVQVSLFVIYFKYSVLSLINPIFN